MKAIIITAAALIAVSSVALAADYEPEQRLDTAQYTECISSANGSYDVMLDCAFNEYKRQDTILNNTYKSVMIEANTAQKQALRQNEREWIQQKHDLCSGFSNPDAIHRATAVAICLVSETEKRTLYLQDLNKP